MRGTWSRIRERLGLGRGLFRRYDGPLTRGEGAFGICSFWAAEFLALGGGSLEEAQENFESLLGFANDVGLYAEEIEPETGAALGNFPQAYTHVGLINAALSIHQRAQRGAEETERVRLRVPEAHP
jgi:GH15 family glucan-1,4-alpha-glucosidase